MQREESLQRLKAHGLIHRSEDGRVVTTKRWQAALRRSSARLVAQGERDGDLRVPVTLALVELYGDRVRDPELAEWVLVLAELESESLPSATDQGGRPSRSMKKRREEKEESHPRAET